jgi:hypothetical protein
MCLRLLILTYLSLVVTAVVHVRYEEEWTGGNAAQPTISQPHLEPVAFPFCAFAAVVHVRYEEEWTGGNATLPNPGSHVANAIGAAVNKITALACPTACCSE